MILPGATLGMLGGGQLGRMFVVAARTMGYHVIVLDPDPNSPAGQIADEHLHAAYSDEWALQQLAKSCDAITTEFENVPSATLRTLEPLCPVRPAAYAVELTQDRIREKTFLRDAGLPTAPFHSILKVEDIAPAFHDLEGPVVLKRAAFGYDGKGQAICNSLEEVQNAFLSMGKVACVLEKKIKLAIELSVVLARSIEGTVTPYPVAENIHDHGILDVTLVPARIDDNLKTRAYAMAKQISAELEYCGIMAVEFFVTHDDEIMVNEIAPRPHNSGHYTLDACVSSQFEQQVRMMCGLPAADTRLLSPVVMVNLLGEAWGESQPEWQLLLQHNNIKLHLYGKQEARPGRKMGHFTVIDEELTKAKALAEQLKQRLQPPLPLGSESG
ncbi:MAG: 5-(carboxyamino)imidazole ribonucleotide synthase [Gammaproteobacteria bacterium]|nr:5-(carboxyamino)imidazole ribonucleotide synthase [Gammaproteobacteria bacterium]